MADEKNKQLSREELLTLSPEERAKRLKQFEEERKKAHEQEINEAKKLVEDTETEIKQKKDRQLTEELLRRNILEEKERIEKIRSLEEAVGHEPSEKKELPNQAEYRTNVEYAINMYTHLKGFLESNTPLNPYERAKVEDMYNVLNQMAGQNPHENREQQTIEDIASATKRIVKTLLGDYHSNVKYTP
jgi:hypothetical protein